MADFSAGHEDLPADGDGLDLRAVGIAGMFRKPFHETVQDMIITPHVPATCLPHTGFAGVWTPATHTELSSHRTIHKHGSKHTSATIS